MNWISKNDINLKNITLVLFSISAWFGLGPYIIVNYTVFVSFFIYTTFLIFLLTNKVTNKQVSLVFAVVYLIICFYFILPGKESPSKDIGLGFLSIGIILFLPINDRVKLFQTFKIIYIITLVPSLLVYFIDNLGLSINYSGIVGFKEGVKGYSYMAFLGNVKTTFSDGLLVYRFQGMYDEPGVVGTISGLLLLIENFNFKKRSNYILLVSGIFSLSLAFYFLSFFYILFVKRLKVKYVIAMLLFISSLFLFKATQYYIIERFNFNERESKFKFDNRASYSFQGLFNSKITKGDIVYKLFGYGANSHAKFQYNVSSYKVLIYNKGYIGFLLIMLFYIIYMKYYLKEWSNRIIILIFLTSIYQRPDIITLFYAILFFGGISKMHQQEIKKNYTQLKIIN